MSNKENDKTTINWYPGHMEKAKRLMLNEYQNIDVVLELVDARIPKSSKLKNVYDIIGNKPKILIMTKKDLTDPEGIRRWQLYYEHLGSKVLVVNLMDDADIKLIINAIKETTEELQLKREAKGLKKKVIGALVIGIPNVGKSTLINKIAGKKVVATGNKPGITKGIKWLKTPHDIMLLDTPGLLWPKLDSEELALNLAAMFSIKTEVVDVTQVAVHILEKLNKYYPDKLKERYGIDHNPTGLDVEEVFNKIGSSIGATKHGEVDYERVANKIINDIKDGYISGVMFDNEI